MQIRKIFFTAGVLVLFNTSIWAVCTPSGTSCAACTTYRCNAGYYGTNRSCRSCTSYTGNANATSAKGSTVISDCYLANGTAYADTKGVGQISGGSCHYVP